MTRTIPDQPVPAEPLARRAWIRLELAKRGYDLFSVSKKKANVHLTLRKAMSRGHSAGEQRIASALGIHPKKIWPERYDSRGRRIKKKPGPKPRALGKERVQ